MGKRSYYVQHILHVETKFLPNFTVPDLYLTLCLLKSISLVQNNEFLFIRFQWLTQSCSISHTSKSGRNIPC